jgi:hypothetical protein
MIAIESNKTTGVSIHDSIKYASLEKQIFDIFSERFKKVTYKMDGKYFFLNLDGVEVQVEIKKTVKLSVGYEITRWYDNGNSRYKGPSANLRLNKDVSNQLSKFSGDIQKLIKANKEGKEIKDWLEDNSGRRDFAVKIQDFLNKHFGGKGLKTSFSISDYHFFDGQGIGFSIHPLNSAPADGVYMHVDTDGTFAPYWNNSTTRRTHGRDPEKIENIVRRMDYEDGIEGMKKKIKAIEHLQKQVDNFDYTKSKEFKELMDKKKRANEIGAKVKGK